MGAHSGPGHQVTPSSAPGRAEGCAPLGEGAPCLPGNEVLQPEVARPAWSVTPSANQGKGDNGLNAWPGYVDALSTLLMVLMFVLLVFVLAQAFLTVTLSSRDKQLDQVNHELAKLTDMLSLARSNAANLQASIAQLTLPLGLALLSIVLGFAIAIPAMKSRDMLEARNSECMQQVRLFCAELRKTLRGDSGTQALMPLPAAAAGA